MLFYFLDNLRHHIKLMELRHDINASRPSLDLVNQFNRDLHPGLDSVVARGFYALLYLIGDILIVCSYYVRCSNLESGAP